MSTPAGARLCSVTAPPPACTSPCSGKIRATLPVGRLADQVVELTVSHTPNERLDLGPSIDECRSVRVPGVAHGDLSGSQPGHLDAVVVSVAAEAALLPPRARQLLGRHAVVGRIHLCHSFHVSEKAAEDLHRAV